MPGSAGVAEWLGTGLQSRLHGFESRHSLAGLLLLDAGQGPNTDPPAVIPTSTVGRAGRWISVYEGRRQFWHCMGEGVLGVMGDAVGVGKAGGGVDVEFGVSVQPVADPTHLHAADLGDARFGGQCSFGRVDEGRVNPVHEAAEYVPHCTAQNGQKR